MNKRILLIEDNPVSREFLHEALLPLGIPVDTADTLATSIDLARRQLYTLLLCDVHLPDGGPNEIFYSLRNMQTDATLVAITAETNPAFSRDLKDIGYIEVLGKPITMQALQDNILRLLGVGNPVPAVEIELNQLWDESAALRAVGNNTATLTALRKMFLTELPRQKIIIHDAFHDKRTSELKAECHKLLAGCGFVGAAGLNHAMKLLSENPNDHQHFRQAMQQAERYLANA